MDKMLMMDLSTFTHVLEAVPFDALTTADEDPAAQLHAGWRSRVGNLKQNNKFKGFLR